MILEGTVRLVMYDWLNSWIKHWIPDLRNAKLASSQLRYRDKWWKMRLKNIFPTQRQNERLRTCLHNKENVILHCRVVFQWLKRLLHVIGWFVVPLVPWQCQMVFLPSLLHPKCKGKLLNTDIRNAKGGCSI